MLIVFFIMWLLLMGWLFYQGNAITKDPCSICANRLNEEVSCTLSGGGKIMTKIFYPNFTKVIQGG